MGEAKRRKLLDPNFGKSMGNNKDAAELPLEEVINYFTAEGRTLYSQEAIEAYRKFLATFGKEPSKNPLDYKIDTNPEYYKVFQLFALANKNYFAKPLDRIANKYRLDRNCDNFNKTLIHSWMALGFAACSTECC